MTPMTRNMRIPRVSLCEDPRFYVYAFETSPAGVRAERRVPVRAVTERPGSRS
jgi:hypothetical protein